MHAMASSGGAPQQGSPRRRAGSVRRTTSHVTTRPEGLDGPAVLHAAGRDLRTGSDNGTDVISSQRLEARFDYLAGKLLSIDLDPAEPRLNALAGKGFFAGFRAEVLRALRSEAQAHSLRYQLLDDIPVAVMANGRSLRTVGRRVTGKTGRRPPYDLCAGYARDGTAVANFSDDGPPLTIGPEALHPARPDDLLSWHEFAPVTPHATCRLRRLDVWREGGKAYADGFFRDSHCDRDGRHTVVHEWLMSVEIDPVARRLTNVTARPGPLPYPECPGSADSAKRLSGLPVDGLRHHVRQTFTGPQTCSHLNDSFRAMEDLGALLDLIPS